MTHDRSFVGERSVCSGGRVSVLAFGQGRTGFSSVRQLFRLQTSTPPYAVRGVVLLAFFFFPSLWEAARTSGFLLPDSAATRSWFRGPSEEHADERRGVYRSRFFFASLKRKDTGGKEPKEDHTGTYIM